MVNDGVCLKDSTTGSQWYTKTDSTGSGEKGVGSRTDREDWVRRFTWATEAWNDKTWANLCLTFPSLSFIHLHFHRCVWMSHRNDNDNTILSIAAWFSTRLQSVEVKRKSKQNNSANTWKHTVNPVQCVLYVDVNSAGLKKTKEKKLVVL